MTRKPSQFFSHPGRIFFLGDTPDEPSLDGENKAAAFDYHKPLFGIANEEVGHRIDQKQDHNKDHQGRDMLTGVT